MRVDDVHEHQYIVHTLQGQEWPAQRHRCVDPCLYEAYMPFSRVIGIEGSFAVNCLVLGCLDIWCSHSLIPNKIFMVISEMRSLRIRSFIQRQNDSLLIVLGYDCFDMTRVRDGDFCLSMLDS